MARKRSSSFKDVVVVLSRLPWWVSLLIGFVSWLILNPVANRPVVVPAGVQIHDMSGVMLSQLWQTFAMFGRYLIPLVCVFGAIGSVFGRQRRKKLLDDVKCSSDPNCHHSNHQQSNVTKNRSLMFRKNSLLLIKDFQ